MRILIVGCGLVGTELARSLRADGHHVIGTTTTAAKVARLSEVCDEVAVLAGGDREKVHAAAAGVDAIVVTAGPAAAQAMTVEQRQRTYRQVLVDTAESVSSVPGTPHLVMLSSLSVYGDAANHLDAHRRERAAHDQQRPEPRDVPGGRAHLPRGCRRPAHGLPLRRHHGRRGPAHRRQGPHGPPGARRLGAVPRRGALLPRAHARRRARDQVRPRQRRARHLQPHPRRGAAAHGAVLRRAERDRRPAAAHLPQRAARAHGPGVRRCLAGHGIPVRAHAGRADAGRGRRAGAAPGARGRPQRSAAGHRRPRAPRPRAGPRRGDGRRRRRRASAARGRRSARRRAHRRVPRLHPRGRRTPGLQRAVDRRLRDGHPPGLRLHPRRQRRCRTCSSTRPSRPTPAARSTSASTSRRASTSARASTTSTRSTRRSPSPARPRSPSRGSCPCRRSVRCSGRCARRG